MKEIVFGVISGIVAALGMGGGTILILLFNLFGNMEQHIIQGINLVFFVPTSLMAIWMNVKHKTIDYKLSLQLIVSGIIGAVFGSLLSLKINNQNLKKYFGFFLLIIAFYQIYLEWKQYKFEKRENNK